ncbi:O-antigen ligase family protein [Tunturibacter psychrotolerans]|uniref:O-antigen ligase family protein n=1 Tax=Tunturiibacter psychrotolerans TaxID=3069686 RepID=A0AAU7ZJ92_9BACT
MYRFWLKMLAGLLFGYMLLDRGFAHFGVPPVYVGELVLLPGILMALVPGAIMPALRTPLGLLYVVFALFNLGCALPYLGRYGVDTVRDSAIWIYGIFFLLASSLLIRRPKMLMRIPITYGRFLVWYTPMLCALMMARFLLHADDETEGGTRLFSIKMGDMGAHLAGVFAFLLLSLDLLWQRSDAKPRASVRYLITATGALAAFVFVSSVNRGGMLSVMIAVFFVALLARKISWGRAGIVLGIAVVGVLIIFGAAGAKVHISAARTLSLDQIETNISSVFNPQGSSNTATSNTAKWRLDWWKKIVGYTFGGSYFWTGKGYGVNLADSDGFQLGKEDVLRAPHNSSMTLLARSGVPGFTLWVALLLTFAFQMIRLVLHAQRHDRPVWSRIALWCFVYWLAMIVDSCFDVALEGPQLGIWFWSLTGFGVALQTVYKERFAYPEHIRVANFAPDNDWSRVPTQPLAQ